MMTPAIKATRAAQVVTTGIAVSGTGRLTGGQARNSDGTLGHYQTSE
jgi:hypothetical protein